jgi:hypothetical protein
MVKQGLSEAPEEIVVNIVVEETEATPVAEAIVVTMHKRNAKIAMNSIRYAQEAVEVKKEVSSKAGATKEAILHVVEVGIVEIKTDREMCHPVILKKDSLSKSSISWMTRLRNTKTS